MWEDPIVADVRRTREKLAEQFDFDVKAIFADMRKRQAALGARLVSRKSQLRLTATRSPRSGARGLATPANEFTAEGAEGAEKNN
jgi:hypothetical protein